MNLEIERRFLLRKIPNLKFEKVLYIDQFYVWSEEKGVFDRYRRVSSVGKEDSFFHTYKKFVKPGVMEEYEEEIKKDDFELNEKRCSKFVSKWRFIYNSGELKWEIDKFTSANLMIAEIELPNEFYELEIPEEIKKEILLEVTNLSQFSNSNLAVEIKKENL